MLTKDKLQQFRDVFDETAKVIQEKTGIIVSLGTINYSSDTFTVKLTGYENQVPSRLERYAKDWKTYAKSFGLDSIALGSSFSHEGKVFEIAGLDIKARLYHVVAKAVENGYLFSFPVDVIRKAFGFKLIEVNPGE